MIVMIASKFDGTRMSTLNCLSQQQDNKIMSLVQKIISSTFLRKLLADLFYQQRKNKRKEGTVKTGTWKTSKIKLIIKEKLVRGNYMYVHMFMIEDIICFFFYEGTWARCICVEWEKALPWLTNLIHGNPTGWLKEKLAFLSNFPIKGDDQSIHTKILISSYKCCKNYLILNEFINISKWKILLNEKELREKINLMAKWIS